MPWSSRVSGSIIITMSSAYSSLTSSAHPPQSLAGRVRHWDDVEAARVAPEMQRHMERALRAWRLLDRLFVSLGFLRVFDGQMACYIKHADSHTIAVWEDGRIYVDDQYICLLPAADTDTPYPDQLSSKLIALATPARNRIKTVTPNARRALDVVMPLAESKPALCAALRAQRDTKDQRRE